MFATIQMPTRESVEQMINSYEDLLVWQKAMELVEEVYRIVKLLPYEERYSLSDQMRRAVISIPSNIAEGQARNSTKEFINFLSIARGSNAELHTQCLICCRLFNISPKEIEKANKLSDEIGKMLNALIKKLSATTTSH